MKLLWAVLLAAGMLRHTSLKSSIPAKDTTVASPATVSLTFTEKVIVPQSSIALLKADSSLMQRIAVKATSDPATIAGAVNGTLAPGRYLIRWKTASDDGHVVRGVFGFTVKPGS
jgi:methionine-rich copper-binding protein CopC